MKDLEDRRQRMIELDATVKDRVAAIESLNQEVSPSMDWFCQGQGLLGPGSSGGGHLAAAASAGSAPGCVSDLAARPPRVFSKPATGIN